MELYKLNGGGLALIYEGRLFVEAEPAEDENDEEDEEEKPKKKTKKSKSGKLGPEAKALLIEELKKGEKSSQELADEYGLSYAGVHYIKKAAGLGGAGAKEAGAFVKKNFQCACGKAFSAMTTGKPGETVECPDECGSTILASEGEKI